MPADPISQYLEDFGAHMGEAKAKAHEIHLNLKMIHNVLVDYGRINEDISPEQRQATKEEDRRAWLESGRQVAAPWDRPRGHALTPTTGAPLPTPTRT